MSGRPIRCTVKFERSLLTQRSKSAERLVLVRPQLKYGTPLAICSYGRQSGSAQWNIRCGVRSNFYVGGTRYQTQSCYGPAGVPSILPKGKKGAV